MPPKKDKKAAKKDDSKEEGKFCCGFAKISYLLEWFLIEQ